MIEPLKSPPKGFEDVTRRHFSVSRKRLLVQAKVWTLEARGTELQGRFERAYSELIVLLSGDKLACCEEWEEAEAGGSMFGTLSPLTDDLQTLQRLDQSLHRTFESELQMNNSGEDQEHGVNDVDEDEEEELNAVMLARALELSLLDNV